MFVHHTDANLPSTPTDFAFKFGETESWQTSFDTANNIGTCAYTVLCGLNSPYNDLKSLRQYSLNLPSYWHAACVVWGCPTCTTKGMNVVEYAQAELNSHLENADGSYVGASDSTWDCDGWHAWTTNPDPGLSAQQNSPGTTRAGLAEFRELYTQWDGGQTRTLPTSGQTFGGVFYDCTGSMDNALGWEATCDFNPSSWATYQYNPGIYWGPQGEGLVTMWTPFQNVQFMDYNYQQMRRENRITVANDSVVYAAALTLPYVDTLTVETRLGGVAVNSCWTPTSSCSFVNGKTVVYDKLSILRAIAGTKPVSFHGMPSSFDPGLTTASEMNLGLPFVEYPGLGDTASYTNAQYEASRTLYEQYMPIFSTLDAALWRPVTGATAADSTQILERYGPDSSGAIYFVLYAPSAGTGTVTCYPSDLGWTSSPSVTVTSLLGTAPGKSFDGSGNLVLSFGSLNATDARVVKLVYSGSIVTPRANFSANTTNGNAPLSVTFTDSSTGSPNAWFWCFGDGTTSTSQSPSHSFSAGGLYTVALTASNANGQDTLTKADYITAKAVPVADFSSYSTYGVPGVVAEFRDRSTNTPTSWSWNFGDGNTSTLQNPTHTYNTAGTYTVTLTPTNANGSGTPLAKSNLVTVKGVIAQFQGSPTSGGPGLVVQFTDDSLGTPTAWSWNFGDSTTSTLQNPSHTYTAAGSYTVTLTAYGGGSSSQYTVPSYTTITAYQASFTPSTTFGTSAPLTVTFTDTSQSNPTSWSWTFGDGGTSTVQNPSHTYTSGGTFTASLTSSNAYGSGSCSATISVASSFVYVYPTGYSMGVPGGGNQHLVSGTLSNLQSADSNCMVFACDTVAKYEGYNWCNMTFTAPSGYTDSQIVGVVVDYVGRTDTGITDVDGRLIWPCSVGDHTPFPQTLTAYTSPALSTSQAQSAGVLDANGNLSLNTCFNPTVNKLETYNIYADFVRWTVYLATAQAPVAAFTGTPTVGAAPLSVSFTDQSSNTPTSWSWTFGDSSTSTAQNPSHTYSSNGTYTVALTATNAQGNNTCTKTGYIAVGNPPVANFSGAPTSGTAPLAVTFTDSSTNSPTAWSWNFGDSNTSTVQSPSHTYSAAGTYTVVLTATNAYGSNTNTKSNYITASSGGSAPVANFSGTPTTGTVPLSVTFTDSSTNTPTSWSWTFGDSSTSTVQNPSHSYTSAGSYTVALTATNAYGNNTNTKTNYITVSSGGGTPVAAFTANQTSGVASLAVTFTDQSTNTPTSWSWTFGDSNSSTVQSPSHTYTAAGVYTVALTATNSLGNNTATYTNYISVRASGGTQVIVTALDYAVEGGGTLVSGQLSDTNNPEDGHYLVVQSTSSGSYSTGAVWDFNTGYTNPAQLAKFRVEFRMHSSRADTPYGQGGISVVGGGGDALGFTSYPTNDGWLVLETTNVARYLGAVNSGCLRVSVCGCGNNSNTYTLSYDCARVVLTLAPAPVANFSGTPTSGPTPLAVSFTDSSTNSPTAWSWTFGDTNTSTVQNPSHTYTGAGSFTVALTATNAAGNNTCTKSNYITATLAAPVAAFTANQTSGVASLAVTFTDQSTNTPTSWSWNFGDSTTSTVQSPSHTFTTAGVYTVALTATNSAGNNTATYTNYISVRASGGTQVIVTALDYGVEGGGTLVSGQLSDTASPEDGKYVVVQSTSSGSYSTGAYWDFNTGYTNASQLTKFRVEFRMHASRADTPNGQSAISVVGGGGDSLGFTSFATNDGWLVWETTNVARYLGAVNSGGLRLAVCGCGSNSNVYTLSYDCARVILTLAPPVANFSGTPTSGAKPLSVTFTDSSTNTPTAWSWNFGDSSTSTVQNPSHSYVNAGTYTVALTATNGGGNNTCTKSNYIAVTGSIPTFVAAGAIASGTGAITPALPSGIATNDILLLFLNTSNQTITIPTPNGGTWTQVTNSPQGTGTGGSSGSVALTVFWSRYNGTQGAPTTSDSGDHQIGRMIAIRGATTSGNPWDVTAGSADATASTTATIPGATTTVANTLVVTAAAVGLPNSTGTANFSAWTNANLSSLTERTDNTQAVGVGGGLGIASGGKATAGAYGNTTVTLAASAKKGMMSIAIKP